VGGFREPAGVLGSAIPLPLPAGDGSCAGCPVPPPSTSEFLLRKPAKCGALIGDPAFIDIARGSARGAVGTLPVTLSWCPNPLPTVLRTAAPSAPDQSSARFAYASRRRAATTVIESERPRPHRSAASSFSALSQIPPEGEQWAACGFTSPASHELVPAPVVVPGRACPPAFPQHVEKDCGNECGWPRGLIGCRALTNLCHITDSHTNALRTGLITKLRYLGLRVSNFVTPSTCRGDGARGARRFPRDRASALQGVDVPASARSLDDRRNIDPAVAGRLRGGHDPQWRPQGPAREGTSTGWPRSRTSAGRAALWAEI